MFWPACRNMPIPAISVNCVFSSSALPLRPFGLFPLKLTEGVNGDAGVPQFLAAAEIGKINDGCGGLDDLLPEALQEVGRGEHGARLWR